MPPAPVRILIADDSAVMRTLYAEVLTADGGFEIVGMVADGQAAVTACQTLRPQVVAMDIEMPKLNGLEATTAIMRDCPTPVVVVSSALDSRASRLAMQAFGVGAVEVVPKPDLTNRTTGLRAVHHLVATLKAMSAVRVMRRRAEPPSECPAAGRMAPPVAIPKQTYRVIGIGASTGGPEALKQLLSALPTTFPVPILVVQHMVPEFLGDLVSWLASTVAVPVTLAQAGQALPPHGVIVAPGRQHLRLERQTGRLLLDGEAGAARYHPSVNVLFESLAAYGPQAIGVLLTGMGDDGARGLGRMRAAGALTMAQDEASSVVWGMPGVAIRQGAASLIGTPQQVAEQLMAVAARPG